ncbi:acyl-CoA dehydrogenase family protein [Actinomadura sp. NPDC023710]|uniref:acyl-CoA dehydrogenase family protein n=1 Tax=Actinomadura sp. NPDC023710 TaxID=3158219 RepID=UPI0033C8C780
MSEIDDQWGLGDQAREFALAEIKPHLDRLQAHPGEVEEEIVRKMARLGWMTVAIPAECGGMGLGHAAKTLLLERISQVSPAMGAALQASQLGAATFLHYGSDDLLRTWMPQVAAGECLPTIAVTEHKSGGHVLGMQSTGRRDGDHYIIDGGKAFVGNSHIGDVHCVVVRTGPDSAGSRKLSAFLVEADRPGVQLAPYQTAIGLHGFSFGDVIFDGVRVPAANMIGQEGDGKDVAYAASILAGRLCLTGVLLGAQQAIFDDTVTYAKACSRYGAPLADLPVIGQRLGAMNARLMTARTIAYTAADLLDQGKPCDQQLIHAKFEAVTTTLGSAGDAMDTHGAAGLRTDRRIGLLTQDARCLAPPAGTNDIQRLRLGEHAAGLDRPQYSLQLAHRTALRPPTDPANRKEHAA